MAYVDEVLLYLSENFPNEPEFLQVTTETLESLRPLVAKHETTWRRRALLERLVEPEKIACFRVPWMDDSGQTHISHGWRVQFNSAIGPYKGGIRFHPSVNLSVMKFLAFEQIFKNSLTGLPIGGGKGGSDFNPKGKSEDELMRFCQSFVVGLNHYIGANIDCPAGDIGCGTKEIGYMFGTHNRLVGSFDAGALTGKPVASGGSLGRDTATGYGAVYFVEELLASKGMQIEGLRFALSGFGNVTWGVAKKLTELGAKVVTISGPDGYVYEADGMPADRVDYLKEMRASLRDRAEDYADRFGAEFCAGEKPWGRVEADIYMPCATQNEILLEDAARMADEGSSKILVETSNMPTKLEALEYLKEQGWTIAPSKAVNAGGVAVSALEMTQNAMKLPWTADEIEDRTRHIMQRIFSAINEAAERYGRAGDLISGANLAGAERVLQAMEEQGVV